MYALNEVLKNLHTYYERNMRVYHGDIWKIKM